MKRSEWEKIAEARQLLEIEEHETLQGIKKAFRRMCKKHHPDLAGDGAGEMASMQEIYEAYNVLLQYCRTFRFPLTPEAAGQPMEAEDWWMDRFGQDPLWGKN